VVYVFDVYVSNPCQGALFFKYKFKFNFKLLNSLLNFELEHLSFYRQDFKNLVGNFGALHVANVHANFQAYNSTGMGGGGGDGQADTGCHPFSHEP